ncbi:MAG: hypothetical protein KKG47_03510 [Proteobacteria bacterium]|nr:hypothetical protein [Pseudomonadota bacterium]MBU1739285.1 hypothetical protein [Pseudomonadota bacterium]
MIIKLIKEYNYAFDARIGAIGSMQLWGEPGKVLDVRFVDDQAAVPAPQVAPDRRSARVYFRQEKLAELIGLLRNERPVGVRITDDGQVDLLNTYGLCDSVVVGPSCSSEILAAKTRGIREAMRRTIDFCEADALPEYCPVTFHLEDGGLCGTYQPGYTGSFTQDPEGLGHVCLFEVEKATPDNPMTVARGESIRDQLLAVHEAMHCWFKGRVENYRIEEPFCKYVSFVVSELSGGPEYCSRFTFTPDEHPDALMKYLCRIGMNRLNVSEVLRQTAEAAKVKGEKLTELEFAHLVSGVLGQNAVPSFQSAGILL